MASQSTGAAGAAAAANTPAVPFPRLGCASTSSARHWAATPPLECAGAMAYNPVPSLLEKHSMIRPATPADIPVIAQLIRDLSEYEKLTHEVKLDEKRLHEHLFGPRRYAEVLLAEEKGSVVGFALFFHNYSTFLAKPGLYLEDVFVKPAHRGAGHGKALLRELARIAVQRDCGRFEWSVLDWNEPAINFYKKLGAMPMHEWSIFRLTGDALRKFAESE
jgi:ribosomal protein S18 acetylase RimI-like enzyme